MVYVMVQQRRHSLMGTADAGARSRCRNPVSASCFSCCWYRPCLTGVAFNGVHPFILLLLFVLLLGLLPAVAAADTTTTTATDTKSSATMATKATTIGYWGFVTAKHRYDAIQPVIPVRLLNLSIGNPPQQFLMRLSFDQTDFWVVDARADVQRSCEASSVRELARYNNSTSTTSLWIRNDRLILRHAHCYVINDTVTIGSTLNAMNISFGSAHYVLSDMIWEFFSQTGHGLCVYDGVLGFGMYDRAGITNVTIPSPVRSFILSKEQAPIFSIWEQQGTTKNVFLETSIRGSLTIGAENTDQCEPHYSYVSYVLMKAINVFPVVPFNGILVNGSTLQIKTRRLNLIDRFGILTNDEDAEKIAVALGSLGRIGNGGPYAGWYQIDCGKMDDGSAPAITIVQLGTNETTSPDGGVRTPNFVDLVLNKYIVRMEKNLCLLPIFGTYSESETISIGMQNLLQNKCLAINYKDNLLGFGNIKSSN